MRFPEIGEVFAGDYRIEKMLGSGGFSRVYKAMQLDLDRAVAIKILQPPIHGGSNNEERDEKLQGLINRFEREARMVSKLKSPHTITMYAYGQDQDGQLFMSLEFVDGRTLTELIRQEGALSPDRVAKIMRQVLVSLYEAHELGMLHRDIKPQNIMVYEHLGLRDQVKLLDFGIVKLISTESTRDQQDLTSDDTLVGTPRYMAPEYIRGELTGPASDLYSLGLVMYELLVGERAIQADSSIQIIGKQLERESFYLPAQLRNIDLALRAIINGMLEKNTSKRYANAAQILQDLEARDQNRNVMPPNAPRLVGVPALPPPDMTERLRDAVTERRSSASNEMSYAVDALPEVEIELLDDTAGIDAPRAPRRSSKRALLLAAVLVVGIGAIGALVLDMMSTSSQASTTPHDTSSEPPSAALLASPEAASGEGVPEPDVAIIAPAEVEEPASVKIEPEEAPPEAPATSRQPKIEVKSSTSTKSPPSRSVKSTRVESKPAKEPAPDKAPILLLPDQEPKSTSAGPPTPPKEKGNAYKVIIAE